MMQRIEKAIDRIGSGNFILMCVIVVLICTLFFLLSVKDRGDWLVIKEDISGNSIQYWELKNTDLNKEDGGGIYFSDKNGNVIHLTKPYTYIKVKGIFEQVKQKYLKEEK